MSILSEQIKNICKQAMIQGKKIDLKDCYYGEPHWEGTFIDYPLDQYFFLAGFVKSQKLTSILEIGTHFGGSIIAMNKGLNQQDIQKSKLVTIDLEYKNNEHFKKFSSIIRIQGDSLDKKTVKKVMSYFDDSIDLIFIDSVHEYKHVKKNLNLYANKLNPKYVILDDIHLSDSMEKLWMELIDEFPNRIFDASKISKRGPAGLGIIQWRKG